MWIQGDDQGVHSVGLGARQLAERFTPETIEALEALDYAALDALHDDLAELLADVLLDLDQEDASVDPAEEARYVGRPLPLDAAFPSTTTDFRSAFADHVASLPSRWRIDAAAVAFEMVGTVLRPRWEAARARRSATWRLAARRRRRSTSRSPRRR